MPEGPPVVSRSVVRMHRGANGQANACRAAAGVTAASSYIGIANTSSAIATDRRCPWILSALDGQRIQVRLVGFYSTRQRQAGSSTSADRCVQLESVLDAGKTDWSSDVQTLTPSGRCPVATTAGTREREIARLSARIKTRSSGAKTPEKITLCRSGRQKVAIGNSATDEAQKYPTGRNSLSRMSMMIAAAVAVTALGIFLSHL